MREFRRCSGAQTRNIERLRSVYYEFHDDGTYHYHCDAWFGRERSDDRTGTYVVCGNWLVLDNAETIWTVVSDDGLALDYTQYETLIDTFVPVT